MRKPPRRDRGQAIWLFVAAIGAMTAFAGLALDGAHLFARKRSLQGAADAAAISAAHELRLGRRDYRQHLLPAAERDALRQGLRPEEIEVVVHHPPATGERRGDPDFVEVSVRGEFPNALMGLFGRHRSTVSARAVAGVSAAPAPCVVATAADADALLVEGAARPEFDCAVAAGAADPFAGLQPPACEGMAIGAAEAREGGEVVFWPGCYDEAVVVSGGRAQFRPGVYLLRGGLRLTGGVVEGRGVVFWLPAGASQRGVEIRESAAVLLSAPERGQHRGILLAQEAGEPAGEAVVERGPRSAYRGLLHFPGRTLRWAPNPPDVRAWTVAVAERIVVAEALGDRRVVGPPEEASPFRVAALVE